MRNKATQANLRNFFGISNKGKAWALLRNFRNWNPLIMCHETQDRENNESGIQRSPTVTTGNERAVREEVVIKLIVGSQSYI